MNDSIRIKLSVGLLAVAVLHAVVLVGLFNAIQCEKQDPRPSRWQVPIAPTNDTPSLTRSLPEPNSVNLNAQNEIKQQCIDCSGVVVRRPVVVQPTPAPILPTTQPTAPRQPHAPAVVAPTKDFQLAIFVGNDAKSQQLLDWFNRDSRLQAMKKTCEFQVYTTGNALYQARFAQDIPSEQFPVVLLQDKSGGHIHAAGRAMIPGSVDALYDDFRKSYELYLQARQAQKTGAIKSRGYSWDASITPTMQLQPGDCPDGFCPDESSDRWKPGLRIRDLLFDQAKDTRDAILWTSASEIATVVLVLFAGLLFGIIVWRRISL